MEVFIILVFVISSILTYYAGKQVEFVHGKREYMKETKEKFDAELETVKANCYAEIDKVKLQHNDKDFISKKFSKYFDELTLEAVERGKEQALKIEKDANDMADLIIKDARETVEEAKAVIENYKKTKSFNKMMLELEKQIRDDLKESAEAIELEIKQEWEALEKAKIKLEYARIEYEMETLKYGGKTKLQTEHELNLARIGKGVYWGDDIRTQTLNTIPNTNPRLSYDERDGFRRPGTLDYF